MSELKPLVIGDLVVEKPIIQGGMGVGISLHRLAGAVAKAGGMGIISAAQIGFREPDFTTNFVEANLRSIRREMKLAREIAPQGAIGFNIMVATKHYDMWVKEAVKAGADIIISGAGLPVSLPEYVEAAYAEMEKKPDRRIKLAPIVSSANQPWSSARCGTGNATLPRIWLWWKDRWPEAIWDSHWTSYLPMAPTLPMCRPPMTGRPMTGR